MTSEAHRRVRSRPASARGDKTLIEMAESTPRGAQEMAAARLAVEVTACLHAAMQAAGLQQQELATRLGLTEGAVSQVLNGDGNLRVATVARYLRAAGFQAHLSCKAIGTAPTVAASSPERAGRVYVTTVPAAAVTIGEPILVGEALQGTLIYAPWHTVYRSAEPNARVLDFPPITATIETGHAVESAPTTARTWQRLSVPA